MSWWIAAYAAVGAAAAGLLGALALRLLRHRSVALSLAVVAVVTVAAMLAGTLSVAWAMFLSEHDLGVVTTVCAIAAVVSLAVTLILGRGGRAAGRWPRRPGRSATSPFAAPPGAPTAELADLGGSWRSPARSSPPRGR